MVLIGIDPYPFQPKSSSFSPLVLLLILSHSTWALRPKWPWNRWEDCVLHCSKRLNHEFVPLKLLDIHFVKWLKERLKKMMQKIMRHWNLADLAAMIVKKIVARINSFRHKKLLMILWPPLMCNCHAGPVVPTWIPDGYVLKVKTVAGKSEPPRSQWRFYATRIIDRYRPSGNLLHSYWKLPLK